ncbi:MAG: carboxypeptidase-like regulatory domain-containing protein, partial [Cyclobacteriaceae bacterium]|nr:carboxypeptidase-like regulatory domain-containing protein [Cyclobacteriaceae bacterium]
LAQTGQISGKVLDSKTQEPLPFANIFINNTTLGVAADANGQYVLKNVPVGVQEIVFSFVGYESYQTRVSVQDGQTLALSVKLVPDDKQLEKVEVTGTRDKKWEKQLEKFKKIFIGTDKVAASCTILNPWALEFTESENPLDDSFGATASQPLEINNPILGYKIYFYLKSFSANTKSYSILGNYRFEEMQTTEGSTTLRWMKNRQEVYNGSDRHLFRAMIEGRVKDEGFLLYTDKPGANSGFRTATFATELNKSVIRFPMENVVTPGSRPGEFKIALKGRLEVHYTNTNVLKRTYRDVPYPVSWIEATGGSLTVTDKGVVVNSQNLVTSGAMSTARIANMLPLDYEPGQTGILVPNAPPSRTLAALKWKRWYEQPYMHTDKPYYYPGEVIWYKGYMNYFIPEMMDSLSRTIHIELLRPSGAIVDDHVLRIDSGMVWGEFILPDTLRPGSYYLRAYTEWMKNYDKAAVFVSELPILNLYDRVENQTTGHATSGNATIQFSKPEYKTRDKIGLQIQVKDEEGKAIRGKVSISVTDAEQVALVKKDRNIVQDYGIRENVLPDKPTDINSFPEYGITVSGHFLNKKKQSQAAKITIVQGQFDDLTTVDTDSVGKFRVSGFQFYDTARLAFQAKDEKGRPFGTIELAPTPRLPFFYNGTGTKLTIQKAENPQRLASDYILPKDSKMLEEVTVRSERIQFDPQKPKLYGKADYVLEGDRLADVAANANLLAGLAGKIPGLQVTWYWDAQMFQHYVVRIRGGSSSMVGSTDPLLLIDGVPYAGEDLNNAFSQISPSSVSRIEVVTRANPVFGVRGTNGTIIVYTKGGGYDATKKQNDPSLKFFSFHTIKGYHRSLPFPSPDYSMSTPENEKPDFRSTIFWSPNLSTDTLVEFYAADLPGKYRVVVEGVTEEGKPISATSVIDVKQRN